MAWGMLPCLGSAMCACTWHFFYNSPDLQVGGGWAGGRAHVVEARDGCCAAQSSCRRRAAAPGQCMFSGSTLRRPSPFPRLQFLVAVQAALTVAGNCTCWLAAYRIYTWAQENPGQQV